MRFNKSNDLHHRYDYQSNRNRAVTTFNLINLGIFLVSIGLWAGIAYLFMEALS